MARRIPTLPEPGEIRINGVVDAQGVSSLVLSVGEGVPATAAEEIFSYLNDTRYSILNMPWYNDAGHEPWPPFYKELESRHYDIATLSFSLFLKSANRPLPKRIFLIKQVPGKIQSYWARVEYSDPDVCSAWGRPCRKADSSLWLSLLSGGTCTETQMLQLGAAKRDFPRYGLLEQLKRLGFDERTIRFSVHTKLALHPEDLPPPPEAKLVKIPDESCPVFAEECPACGAKDGEPCTDVHYESQKGVALSGRVHAGRLEDYKAPRQKKVPKQPVRVADVIESTSDTATPST